MNASIGSSAWTFAIAELGFGRHKRRSAIPTRGQKTEAGFKLIWCSTASKMTAEYGEMLVAQFHAHQGIDQSQHNQSQHHGGIGIRPGSRSMPKITHRDRRRGLDTSRSKIPQRCRGRMRGANALCDLGCLRIGAAKPHQQTKWAGKSGTMTNAPVAAWALSGTCGG